MGVIETFAQRQKAGYIYNTFFDPYSEYDICFDLLDTLNFYGAITQKGFEKLTVKFEDIGNKLWEEMKTFDKKQLNKKL